MPSYQAEETGKEPGEIQDLALTLKDRGDSVNIYEATTKKHTEPATHHSQRWHGIVARISAWGWVHILYHLVAV